MNQKMIDGVIVKQLPANCNEQGYFSELIRSDWNIIEKFGQVFLTAIYPGTIKAWHYHRSQIDHFVCVCGSIKLVLYDVRETSPTNGITNEFMMSESSLQLIKIPAYVYHGYQCTSPEKAVIINVSTELYKKDNPDEVWLPFDTREIPYQW